MEKSKIKKIKRFLKEYQGNLKSANSMNERSFAKAHHFSPNIITQANKLGFDEFIDVTDSFVEAVILKDRENRRINAKKLRRKHKNYVRGLKNKYEWVKEQNEALRRKNIEILKEVKDLKAKNNNLHTLLDKSGARMQECKKAYDEAISNHKKDIRLYTRKIERKSKQTIGLLHENNELLQEIARLKRPWWKKLFFTMLFVSLFGFANAQFYNEYYYYPYSNEYYPTYSIDFNYASWTNPYFMNYNNTVYVMVPYYNNQNVCTGYTYIPKSEASSDDIQKILELSEKYSYERIRKENAMHFMDKINVSNSKFSSDKYYTDLSVFGTNYTNFKYKAR